MSIECMVGPMHFRRLTPDSGRSAPPAATAWAAGDVDPRSCCCPAGVDLSAARGGGVALGRGRAAYQQQGRATLVADRSAQ